LTRRRGRAGHSGHVGRDQASVSGVSGRAGWPCRRSFIKSGPRRRPRTRRGAVRAVSRELGPIRAVETRRGLEPVLTAFSNRGGLGGVLVWWVADGLAARSRWGPWAARSRSADNVRYVRTRRIG
jgi:hypothetical protein